MGNKDNEKYNDIINMPHHISMDRPHMSIYDRAAQFSPFAALTGYESAIKETQRLTEAGVELDEDAKIVLDEKMMLVQESINCKDEPTEIAITYFKPDEKKEGGEYVTARGNVRKIDGYTRTVIMQDQSIIPIDKIIDMNGEIFNTLGF